MVEFPSPRPFPSLVCQLPVDFRWHLCRMDVSRTWNPPVASSEASTSTAPSFPGLVSSLRPLKRLSTQLADEASLLRRFSYKNKNQHKGCGWWRKVVEVDRVLERVGTELDGLLGEFGME